LTKLYISREGTIATTATKTPLQKFGSSTVATDITVPTGVTSLNHIIGWVNNAAASTTGTADYMFRTEGNGLPNGPECWALGACASLVAAVQGAGGVPVYYTNVGLPVKAGGNTISLFGDSTAATTLCASTAAVTCVFDSAKAPTAVTRTYDVATSTTQTDVTMTAQGSNANPSTSSPASISQLARITAFVASSQATVGRQVNLLRISGQSIGTELDLAIGSWGGDQATTTNLVWSNPFQIGHDCIGCTFPMDTPAKPTNAFTVQMSNAETNTGATQGVVTLEFT
jgi:hypothetical protein